MALIAELHDVVRMKKPHPCGSFDWEVVRTGADYKLRCLKCEHVVMLTPDELKKRVKSIKKEQSNG